MKSLFSKKNKHLKALNYFFDEDVSRYIYSDIFLFKRIAEGVDIEGIFICSKVEFKNSEELESFKTAFIKIVKQKRGMFAGCNDNNFYAFFSKHLECLDYKNKFEKTIMELKSLLEKGEFKFSLVCINDAFFMNSVLSSDRDNLFSGEAFDKVVESSNDFVNDILFIK